MAQFRPKWASEHPEALNIRLPSTLKKRLQPFFTGGPGVIKPVPKVPLPSDTATYSTLPRPRAKWQDTLKKVTPLPTIDKDRTLPGEFGADSLVPFWGAGVAGGPGTALPTDSAVPKDASETPSQAGFGNFILYGVLIWWAVSLLMKYKKGL